MVLAMEKIKEAEVVNPKQRTKKSVVLLSGGLDSAVTAYIAKQDCNELYALSFDYGQTHKKELQCAALIAGAAQAVEHAIVPLNLNSLVGKFSSLFDKDNIPSDGKFEGIPTTWVPQRNSVFLAIAFGWAEVVGADKVYIGANCLDYSGYPDCRPLFFMSFNGALNLASKQFAETGRIITIETPIIGKTKKEIVSLGLKLGVPFQYTWSCYKGGEKPCGVCDSCRIRNRAFQELGITDPSLN